MKKNYFITLSLLLASLFSQSQNTFNCTSHFEFNRMMVEDPHFKKNQEQLEKETEAYLQNNPLAKSSATATYIIPVVFHVIYTTPAGNISDAQILDQIDILNEEFNRLQGDASLTPVAFQPLAAPFSVEFRLATIDPSGNCTNGINRVYNTLTNCSVKENDVKSVSYWPSNKYLNIWVTQTMHYAGSISCDGGGYAQFPGGLATTDGINIRGDLIGSIGTAATNTGWGNFKGRYLIHELGHWFNLRHIWGDANCGNDLVADTPPAVFSNSGCPNFPHNAFNNCGAGANGEMFTNYMDYTNGPCLNMFTAGQVTRMTAAINSGVSGRNNLWTINNLNATGTNDPYTYPVACAAVPEVLQNGIIVACVGDSVKLTDNSYGGNKTSRVWNFGGEPASSLTDSIVKVKYSFPGAYTFTLTNNYANTSKSTVFTNKIYIIGNTHNPLYYVPFEDSFESQTDFYNDWVIIDNDNDLSTWEYVTSTAYTGFNSIGVANYDKVAPTLDEIISPAYDLRAVQNPSLTFRLNFTRRTTNDNDQLQVFISNNCGKTWTSLYLKNANGSLKTSTTVQPASYTPAISSNEWRLEKVNIQPFLAQDVVRFKFSFTSGGGNNLFIDDINVDGINTTGLKNYTKQNKVSIFPNPASNQLTLNYSGEGGEITIEIIDVLGHTVKECTSGKTLEKNKSTTINLNSIENGIYIIRVKQQGKYIHSEKLIKESAD
jgi:hypothetical protein